MVFTPSHCHKIVWHWHSMLLFATTFINSMAMLPENNTVTLTGAWGVSEIFRIHTHAKSVFSDDAGRLQWVIPDAWSTELPMECLFKTPTDTSIHLLNLGCYTSLDDIIFQCLSTKWACAATQHRVECSRQERSIDQSEDHTCNSGIWDTFKQTWTRLPLTIGRNRIYG